MFTIYYSTFSEKCPGPNINGEFPIEDSAYDKVPYLWNLLPQKDDESGDVPD